MHFSVTHTTRHTYSRPIFLEPHTIRLRPRSDVSQKLLDFALRIDPVPVALTEALDLEGNSVTHAWFENTTESLVVTASFEVETLRTNPFDYILLEPATSGLPVEYSPDLSARLAPYRNPSSKPDTLPGQFAQSIAREAGGATLAFLSALNQRIFETHEVEIREQGDPYPAERTLSERRAACRDLAVLYVECCRLQGIAARFVSGYQAGDPDSEDRRYMHAWAEVYLPGGGWRGYDPTHGLAVADGHVAVAAGTAPEFAAPISGTFRGTAVSSRLEPELKIQVTAPEGDPKS